MSKQYKIQAKQIVLTRGVAENEDHVEVLALLVKHSSGDWGELNEEDAARQRANFDTERIMSVWKSTTSLEKIWIITEWDRSVTTVLYPHDY